MRKFTKFFLILLSLLLTNTLSAMANEVGRLNCVVTNQQLLGSINGEKLIYSAFNEGINVGDNIDFDFSLQNSNYGKMLTFSFHLSDLPMLTADDIFSIQLPLEELNFEMTQPFYLLRYKNLYKIQLSGAELTASASEKKYIRFTKYSSTKWDGTFTEFYSEEDKIVHFISFDCEELEGSMEKLHNQLN